MRILTIFVMLILLSTIYGMSTLMRSQNQKIEILEQKLLKAETAHSWIPVLEQILPEVAQNELDCMTEALKQMKAEEQ